MTYNVRVAFGNYFKIYFACENVCVCLWEDLDVRTGVFKAPQLCC